MKISQNKNFIYIDKEENGIKYSIDLNTSKVYNLKTNREVKNIPFSTKSISDICIAENDTIWTFFAIEFPIAFKNMIKDGFLSLFDKYFNFFISMGYYKTALKPAFNYMKKNRFYGGTMPNLYDIFGYLLKTKDFESILKKMSQVKENIQEYLNDLIQNQKIISIYDFITFPSQKVFEWISKKTPLYKIIKDNYYIDSRLDNGNKEYLYVTLYQNLVGESEELKDLFIYYYFSQKYQYVINSVYDMKSILKTYIKNCKKLDKKPEKSTNGMREFAETNKTYLLMRDTLDKKQWTKIYDEYKNRLTFSYGDYTVILPNEPQDLITEGLKMHHCVGGYIDNVMNDDDLIIFIRHKNDLNTPYITAQIKKYNGQLYQYYLAYDQKISKQEDIDFKQAYQEHLKMVW